MYISYDKQIEIQAGFIEQIPEKFQHRCGIQLSYSRNYNAQAIGTWLPAKKPLASKWLFNVICNIHRIAALEIMEYLTEDAHLKVVICVILHGTVLVIWYPGFAQDYGNSNALKMELLVVVQRVLFG